MTVIIIAIILLLLFAFVMAIAGADSFIFAWVLPDGVYQGLSNLLHGISYVLPMYVIVPIIIAKEGLKLATITWSLILRIKSFIPFFGN